VLTGIINKFVHNNIIKWLVILFFFSVEIFLKLGKKERERKRKRERKREKERERKKNLPA